MNQALSLIDQLIEMAQAEQRELNRFYHMTHQSRKTVGDTSLVYHLNVLKKLIREEYGHLGRRVTIENNVISPYPPPET